MWRGGVSSERARLIQTKDYYDWRNDVFKRDNFICGKCGKRGGPLNAHHIESFSENPTKRMDPENGKTFCKECHIEFHNIFGRKEIGLNQLNLYIQESEEKITEVTYSTS